MDSLLSFFSPAPSCLNLPIMVRGTEGPLNTRHREQFGIYPRPFRTKVGSEHQVHCNFVLSDQCPVVNRGGDTQSLCICRYKVINRGGDSQSLSYTIICRYIVINRVGDTQSIYIQVHPLQKEVIHRVYVYADIQSLIEEVIHRVYIYRFTLYRRKRSIKFMHMQIYNN